MRAFSVSERRHLMPRTQPVSFLPNATSADFDAISADHDALSAERPSTSANLDSISAELQLTAIQSSGIVTAEYESSSVDPVSLSAEVQLTCRQPHICCRTRQSWLTRSEPITVPQRGRGEGYPFAGCPTSARSRQMWDTTDLSWLSTAPSSRLVILAYAKITFSAAA